MSRTRDYGRGRKRRRHFAVIFDHSPKTSANRILLIRIQGIPLGPARRCVPQFANSSARQRGHLICPAIEMEGFEPTI